MQFCNHCISMACRLLFFCERSTTLEHVYYIFKLIFSLTTLCLSVFNDYLIWRVCHIFKHYYYFKFAFLSMYMTGLELKIINKMKYNEGFNRPSSDNLTPQVHYHYKNQEWMSNSKQHGHSRKSKCGNMSHWRRHILKYKSIISHTQLGHIRCTCMRNRSGERGFQTIEPHLFKSERKPENQAIRFFRVMTSSVAHSIKSCNSIYQHVRIKCKI